MASSNDLIKYVTEEVVRYLDTPKQHRQRKMKGPITYQWFGFMPLAITMMFQSLYIHFKKGTQLVIISIRYIAAKIKSCYTEN